MKTCEQRALGSIRHALPLLSRLGMMAVLTLTACAPAGSWGSGDAVSTPNAGKAALVYPTGILTTLDAQHAIRGVFPDRGFATDSCCWVGPDVQFVTVAQPDAKRLTVTVYEPSLSVLSSQSLSVMDVSGKIASSRPVVAGLQTFTLPLPRGAVRAGVARVHLHMGRSFVPKEVGINADPRRLAVVLRDVAAR